MTAPRPGRGTFIAFEGGEGAGKSTQAGLLAATLAEAGIEVVRTREPGGSSAAEAIRGILLDTANAGMSPHAEALLFAAARAEHVHRTIGPALARDATVITDRYLASSLAYQGVARGLGVDAVAELSLWATDGLRPDLTIVLDIDPALGLARVRDANRLETEPAAFHRVVRAAFLDLAATDPDHHLVLDATGDLATIATTIRQRVLHVLRARAGA